MRRERCLGGREGRVGPVDFCRAFQAVDMGGPSVSARRGLSFLAQGLFTRVVAESCPMLQAGTLDLPMPMLGIPFDIKEGLVSGVMGIIRGFIEDTK